MDEEIISTFCILDDYIKYIGLSSRRNAKFSFSELTHFALIAAKYFGGNLAKTYNFFLFAKTYRRLPSRSKINRRLLKIDPNFWIRLLTNLNSLRSQSRIHTFLIDSFPVFACSPSRSYRCKLYQGKEWIGYNSSRKTFFYGIKVHMVTTEFGMPVTFCFLPASVSDLGGLRTLIHHIKAGSVLVGDKAYWSSKLIESLGEREIFLVAPKRYNAKKPHKKELDEWIKKTRQRIETSFSQILKNMNRSLTARSSVGFEARIIFLIMAYALSLA